MMATWTLKKAGLFTSPGFLVLGNWEKRGMTSALKVKVQRALGAKILANSFFLCAADRRYQRTNIRPANSSTLSLLLLMAKGKAPKSWAEQLADLEDPAPRGWFDCFPLAEANILQSLIQRMMLGNSRKRTAQIQLAMTMIQRKLVDTTHMLGTQSLTEADLGSKIDNIQEEQTTDSRWL